MNRRSFLAVLVAATMRCGFGLRLPEADSKYGLISGSDMTYYFKGPITIDDLYADVGRAVCESGLSLPLDAPVTVHAVDELTLDECCTMRMRVNHD